MSLNSINNSQYTNAYSNYSTSKSNTNTNTKAADVETKNTTDPGAVYEKSSTTEKKATYSINKMSDADRAALVDQMKADQAARQQNLVSLVTKMMNKQATSYTIANGKEDDDSIWKFLADGNFTVDAETKAQAQEDISEDGYWGVNQTSQRLFDFASALAGDDVEKMKKMQDAMLKGFKEATKSWGKELPGICKDTLDAANKLFDDYYDSKK